MAYRYTGPVSEKITKPTRRQRFLERFPDYLSWLDGNTWAIPVTDIVKANMGVPGFRASLHYQAKTFGLSIATSVTKDVDENGKLIHVFLVKADREPEPQ